MQQPRPYSYVEFPKWVTRPGAAPTMVHTAEQEAAAMAAPDPTPPADRDALRQVARDLGVTVDGRWSVDRLNAEIAAARAAQPEQSP